MISTEAMEQCERWVDELEALLIEMTDAIRQDSMDALWLHTMQRSVSDAYDEARELVRA